MLWLIAILVLTQMPGSETPRTSLFEGFDKIIHGSIFAVFVLLMVVGFIKQRKYIKLRTKAKSIALTIGIVIGVILEIVQSAVPDRSFEWLDMLANVGGSLTGILLFYWIYRV